MSIINIKFVHKKMNTITKHLCFNVNLLLILLILVTNAAGMVNASGSERQVIPFDSDWKFILDDPQNAQQTNFNDSQWRELNLPHDWGIENPFTQNAPTGGGGGYATTGIGWYRKNFTLPEKANKQVWIEFDGVFENGSVWINGHLLGTRPFGYISFHYDLTDYLVEGENIIAVKVDNSNQPNSRWYTGSGIYRHVRLISTNNLHVTHWGTYATTSEVSQDSATVSVKTMIVNEGSNPVNSGLLRSILIDNKGNEKARAESNFNIGSESENEIEQKIEVESPSLWSTENPYLYTLKSEIVLNNSITDSYETTIGIRKIEYDAVKGFLLNDKQVKMHGVNLHHEGGAVGSAVPKQVWKRRLEILKGMGCNAIRTSHNPPAPEFLDLCDELGFLVMDEAFDEWKIGKVRNGYNLYFDEWSDKDLTDFIHRDRNHPSVVMWSVGNEIREQPTPNGHEVLKKLADIVHKEDPSRLFTLGCDNIAADGGSTTLEFLEGLDIVGYNYVDRWHDRRELYYSIDKLNHPDWLRVGTESANISGTRCSYDINRKNYTMRMIRVEQLWKFVRMHDYVIGDFMWTGIDYLGETRWPSRGSGSGVLDMAGFPKDGYYFYQSQWTEEPMIHIFPHWNWQGSEGQFIPVLAYTNCDTVELYLNDKLIGTKSLEFPRQGNSGGWNRYATRKINVTTADLHLSWDVPYEPGVLRAVGRKNGQIVCTEEVCTTGQPSAIKLSAYRDTISTGRDIVHVKVEIVDSDGLIVPDSNNLVNFSIEGQGKIIAVDSGNLRDLTPFQKTQRNACGGLCLVIIESTNQQGAIELTAESEGLKSSTARINVQP